VTDLNNNLSKLLVPTPLRPFSNDLARIAVTYRSPIELTIAPGNPRVHTPRQIKQIAGSIRVFGFLIPIIIDEADRVLLGIGRLLAARNLGCHELPTIQVTHLSEAQKTAFAIADNQLAAIAKWDDPVLAEQLKALSIINLDFDIEVTGFGTAEIDLRIESLNLEVDHTDPADTLPAAPTGEPVSRLGDLWILGRHRLLCGDALDPAAYTRLMNGKKAEMIFTDSPYNVKIDGHVTGLGANRHREFAMASGEMSYAEFQTFLLNACLLLARHSSDGSIHFLWMDWRHSGELLAAGRAVYSEHKSTCVWVKSNAGMGSQRVGRRCYGLEIDPLYVDTIIRRWQAQTGLRGSFSIAS
jgi:hypothetical protein